MVGTQANSKLVCTESQVGYGVPFEESGSKRIKISWDIFEKYSSLHYFSLIYLQKNTDNEIDK